MEPIVLRRVAAFSIDAATLWLLADIQMALGWEGSVWINGAMYLAYRGVFPVVSTRDTFGRWAMGISVQPVCGGEKFFRVIIPARELPIALALASPLLGLKLGLLLLFSGTPILLAVDLTFALLRSDARSLRDLIFRTRVSRR